MPKKKRALSQDPESSTRAKVDDDVKMSDAQYYEPQFDVVLGDSFKKNLFRDLPTEVLINFSKTCHQLYDWTEFERAIRETKVVSKLLLAVVRGNELLAKHLLKKPGLLFSSRGIATDYSNRLSENDTPFKAALRADDIEMCEMMMKTGFDKLKGGQAELEKQFKEVFPHGIDAHVEAQRATVFDFNPIIEAIRNAPKEEVVAALRKRFDNNLPLHKALDTFRKAFTDKSHSETVFNPYHLLRAFEIHKAQRTKAYREGRSDDNSMEKGSLFWIQVVGYVQRYLPVCYEQAFVQGLYFIVQEIEPLRRLLKFKTAPHYDFPKRDFFPLMQGVGLGFDFALHHYRPDRAAFECHQGEYAAVFLEFCEMKHQARKKLFSFADSVPVPAQFIEEIIDAGDDQGTLEKFNSEKARFYRLFNRAKVAASDKNWVATQKENPRFNNFTKYQDKIFAINESLKELYKKEEKCKHAQETERKEQIEKEEAKGKGKRKAEDQPESSTMAQKRRRR